MWREEGDLPSRRDVLIDGALRRPKKRDKRNSLLLRRKNLGEGIGRDHYYYSSSRKRVGQIQILAKGEKEGQKGRRYRPRLAHLRHGDEGSAKLQRACAERAPGGVSQERKMSTFTPFSYPTSTPLISEEQQKKTVVLLKK